MDFKEQFRRLYSPSAKACEIVDVPEMSFLMIDGGGDPNTSREYIESIVALYSVSYTLKFTLKKSGGPDFRVMPLEGLWWVEGAAQFGFEDKSLWNWTSMITQPDFVTPEIVASAVQQARERKELPALAKMRFERFREGPAAQTMHVGPYAAEQPTIEKLHAFIAAEGYEPAGRHHEIYLGDPRRSAPEKLRTIVRQPVRRP